MPEQNYFLECKMVGHIAKITAIDPVSGIEVVVQGPAHTAQTTLPRLAVQKLEYMIEKRQSGE